VSYLSPCRKYWTIASTFLVYLGFIVIQHHHVIRPYIGLTRFDEVLLIYQWTVSQTKAYMLSVGEGLSSISILRAQNNSTELNVKEIQVCKKKKLF
jgi:hypothetical protein